MTASKIEPNRAQATEKAYSLCNKCQLTASYHPLAWRCWDTGPWFSGWADTLNVIVLLSPDIPRELVLDKTTWKAQQVSLPSPELWDYT